MIPSGKIEKIITSGAEVNEEGLIAGDKNVLVSNKVFQSVFFLDKSEIIRTLVFQQCTFESGISISNISADIVIFRGCLFSGMSSIKFSKFESLDIRYCSTDMLIIENCDIAMFDLLCYGSSFHLSGIRCIKSSQINLFPLSSSGVVSFDADKSKGIINFNYVSTHEFSISGNIEADTTLIVHQAVCPIFEIGHFVNRGNFRLSNILSLSLNTQVNLESTGEWYTESIKHVSQFIENDRTLTFTDAQFGSTLFDKINFDRLNKFEINNSLLLECSFVEIMWPEMTLFDKLLTSKTSVNPEYPQLWKQDVYKQLKTAAINRQDNFGEAYFHALELEAYRKSKVASNEPGTNFLLWLSFTTSRYGQSIIRPIYTILIINVPLFAGLILLHAAGHLQMSIDLSPMAIFNTVGDFLKYSNPFREFNDKNTGTAYIIDLIMRIVSTYCLYNFVKASRRFVK